MSDDPPPPFPRVTLEAWYVANGRHRLPWRLTRDPYAVLVSEVMLQQTQVSRALPAWEAWMARWPTFASLADATPAEVLRAWAGMGYNRRAINLHRAASVVGRDMEGVFPCDPLEAARLPGIGPYTATAVASFAFARPVPVLDTNVGRVVARHDLDVALPSEVSAARLRNAAAGILPSDGEAARHHNLALMDLGALVCTSRAPKCHECPLATTCAWLERGSPPAGRVRKPAPPFEQTARFARGRIIDALRRGPCDEAALRSCLPGSHAARLESYLAALEREGLVSRAGGFEGPGWTLGPAQGSSSMASPNE